jgi:hypothetical protein
MFVGLEEYMARKNSRVSLKPISRAIGKAVGKLRKIRKKASAADRKKLSKTIATLDKAGATVNGLCVNPFNRKGMIGWPIVKSPRSIR